LSLLIITRLCQKTVLIYTSPFAVVKQLKIKNFPVF
jgi:hypothetical protein